jgi:hypothetical protein
MNSRYAVAGLLGIVALAVGGCGSSGTNAGSQSSAQLSSSDRQMIRYAVCMRGHGAHVPDPTHIPGHNGLSLNISGGKTPAFQRADRSCGRYIASLVALKEQGARATLTESRRLGLVHYAECMRQHGIPMLDPDQFGTLNLGNVPGISAVGRYTPVFRHADQACRSLLPAGVRDNGSGP